MDPGVMERCVPGCESLVQTGPCNYTAKIALAIGPVKARFETLLEVTDPVHPASYRLSGQGRGGPVGFGKGVCPTSWLEPAEHGITVLRVTPQAFRLAGVSRSSARGSFRARRASLPTSFFAAFALEMDAGGAGLGPGRLGAGLARRVRHTLNFRLNGEPVAVDVASEDLLVAVLRDRLGLTGTHVGCDTSQCGCCVVHVDERAVKSCSLLAVSVDGAEVTTIEGLAAESSCIRCRRRSPRVMRCSADSARPA